jgi:hypothetical protein
MSCLIAGRGKSAGNSFQGGNAMLIMEKILEAR